MNMNSTLWAHIALQISVNHVTRCNGNPLNDQIILRHYHFSITFLPFLHYLIFFRFELTTFREIAPFSTFNPSVECHGNKKGEGITPFKAKGRHDQEPAFPLSPYGQCALPSLSLQGKIMSFWGQTRLLKKNWTHKLASRAVNKSSQDTVLKTVSGLFTTAWKLGDMKICPNILSFQWP